jgi:hypothetical protein
VLALTASWFDGEADVRPALLSAAFRNKQVTRERLARNGGVVCVLHVLLHSFLIASIFLLTGDVISILSQLERIPWFWWTC